MAIAGCVRERGKEWMGYLLDDFKDFGINADQWTTAAAQDKGERRRTAEQGLERFMAKWMMCRESQDWTTACNSRMPECDGKDQGADSPKQVCSCWFARQYSLTIHKWRELVSSGRSWF